MDHNRHGSKIGFKSWWLHSLLDQISKQVCLSLTEPSLVLGYLSEHLVSHKEWNPAVLTRFWLPIGNCMSDEILPWVTLIIWWVWDAVLSVRMGVDGVYGKDGLGSIYQNLHVHSMGKHYMYWIFNCTYKFLFYLFSNSGSFQYLA